jgi:hypothetical protein
MQGQSKKEWCLIILFVALMQGRVLSRKFVGVAGVLKQATRGGDPRVVVAKLDIEVISGQHR